MTVDMAANVYGDGQSRNVGWVGVDIDSERSRSAAQPAGTDASAVDFVQKLFFHLLYIWNV